MRRLNNSSSQPNKVFSFSKLRFVILLVVFIFKFESKAQTTYDQPTTIKTHQITTATGYMAYNNNITIPNGLPGLCLGLNYQFLKRKLGAQHFFIYDAQLSYSALVNKYITQFPNSNYSYAKLNSGGSWLFSILKTNNANLFIGSGFYATAEIVNPITKSTYVTNASIPFGYWAITNNVLLAYKIKVNKLTIKNTINMPVLGFGYFVDLADTFTEFNASEKIIGLLTTPNKITHMGNHMLVNNALSFSYPLKNMIFNLSYIFSYNYNNFTYFNQHYVQHQLGIGLTF